MRSLLPAVLIVVCAIPVAAQSGDSPQRAKNPYRNLFQSKSLDQVAKPPALPAPREEPRVVEKPRVVCGMTIIPAPNVDPKMVVEPRTDSTRHTIRAIDPPICNPAVRDR
jgi:hypothetical protein